MSLSDPIADMLTRIRNGQATQKKTVSMSSSNTKKNVAEVLKLEGYISDYQVDAEEKNKPILTVYLKYYAGKPVISLLKRVSRPGLRQYKPCGDLPNVKDGLGTAIVSTSKGVMSDREARKIGYGGEVLCIVA